MVTSATSSYKVVGMPADGSCLFHAISYLVQGDIDTSGDVRRTIVKHVVQHWDELQLYTCQMDGSVFGSSQSYRNAMIKTSTFGSAAELMAAADIYPFTFQVYENDVLRFSFGGKNGGSVKRLRFSGSFLRGHYDVIIPASTKSSPTNILRNRKDNEDNKNKDGRSNSVEKESLKALRKARLEKLKEIAARQRIHSEKTQKANIDIVAEAFHTSNATEAKHRLILEEHGMKTLSNQQIVVDHLNEIANQFKNELKIVLERLKSRSKDNEVKRKFEELFSKSGYQKLDVP